MDIAIVLCVAEAVILLPLGFICGNLVKKKEPALPEPIQKEIIDYDEDAIIKHLNFVIDESIDRYFLYEITPKRIEYINSTDENKMINSIQEDVSKKISDQLINQLGLIYNEDYIGTAIGEHIYAMCVERIVDFNVNHQRYESSMQG